MFSQEAPHSSSFRRPSCLSFFRPSQRCISPLYCLQGHSLSRLSGDTRTVSTRSLTWLYCITIPHMTVCSTNERLYVRWLTGYYGVMRIVSYSVISPVVRLLFARKSSAFFVRSQFLTADKPSGNYEDSNPFCIVPGSNEPCFVNIREQTFTIHHTARHLVISVFWTNFYLYTFLHTI